VKTRTRFLALAAPLLGSLLLACANVGAQAPGQATPAQQPPPPTPGQGQGRMTMAETLSDEAQRNTIAFDGLAFLTGSLGADSFFPPGKVADFWGFQYLRDNDSTGMGHNTDFLTSASLNMLQVLQPAQRAELIQLAESQVDDIRQYGLGRFVLMDAFRRLLAGSMPAGATGLNLEAVQRYSSELYQLDGAISFERARVMGAMIRDLSADQRAYLDAMKGKGMSNWPKVEEPEELRGLEREVKVAVMTYAGDMYSWYAGSVEADVYFCPERQGTYFGSFYLKDAPAVGNPGYSIPTNLTGDMGAAFLKTLTPVQAALVTALVDAQRPALLAIVDRRTDVSKLLRGFQVGEPADEAAVMSLMGAYGELDGEIIYRYATAFAQVDHTLTAAQRASLVEQRTKLLGDKSLPTGAYLYSDPIPMPEIPSSDFLFTGIWPTATPTATATPTVTPTRTQAPDATPTGVPTSAPPTEPAPARAVFLPWAARRN
jgi:hypothetical protein